LLLSDVTLTSLLAAPLSTYHGKKYWANKQNVAYEEGGFVFSDGTPMEPLTEVLQKYESVASELATYTNASPDAENIKKGDANLTLLTQIRERFYHYVYEVVSQDKIRNNVYYDNNAHYSTCFIITCNDYDDYINSDNYITLNSLLEDANLGLTLPQIAKITSKNKLNAKEYSSQFITVYNTVINEQPSWKTINLLDGGNFIVKLDELIKKYHFAEYPYVNISVAEEFDWPNITDEDNIVNCSCLGGKSQMGILVNGDITICCLDYLGHTKLGNIYESKFSDILNNELYQNVLKGWNDLRPYFDLCKKCTYRNRFKKEN
jgi:radical SAM protein with 4Fe4S-binding SPASM domain